MNEYASVRGRCKTRRLNSADHLAIQRYCHVSPVRMIKEIRLPFVSSAVMESLRSLSRQPDIVLRIVALVRRPYDVVVSQYKAGWHGKELTHHGLLRLAAHICKNMLTVRTLVRGFGADNATRKAFEPGHTVNSDGHEMRYESDEEPPLRHSSTGRIWRYEDVNQHLNTTLQDILHFVGLAPSATTIRAALALSTRTFANMGKKRNADRIKHISSIQDRLQEAIARVKPCQTIYSQYNYPVFVHKDRPLPTAAHASLAG